MVVGVPVLVGVLVAVGVWLGDKVWVGVAVLLGVGVIVAVRVRVGVSVMVAVLVGIDGLGVSEGSGGCRVAVQIGGCPVADGSVLGAVDAEGTALAVPVSVRVAVGGVLEICGWTGTVWTGAVGVKGSGIMDNSAVVKLMGFTWLPCTQHSVANSSRRT